MQQIHIKLLAFVVVHDNNTTFILSQLSAFLLFYFIQTVHKVTRWPACWAYACSGSLPFDLYTVNHKKRDILFLTITLANLNRFL